MLNITLLGDVQITLNGIPVDGFISAKARALFCYLAATDQTHHRDVLVGLFWADVPEEKAKRSLRVALTNLRKALPGAIDATRTTVGFNRVCLHWIDADAFQFSLRPVLQNAPDDFPDRPDILAALRAGVDLYRGDFLADVRVKDAPAFEEWLIVERERLRLLMIRALQRLIHTALDAGRRDDAIGWLRRLLALDPLHETEQRRLMLALAHNGELTAALAQYESYRQVLAAELDVPPMPETEALRRRIEAVRTRPSRHNLPAPATPFVGRAEELQRLARLILAPDHRLNTIVGAGGMGKTRLALEVATRHADVFLEGAYFVSLEGLEDVKALASHIAAAVGLSVAGKGDAKTLLLNYLRNKELLLVLDNLEHLLDGARLLAEFLETAPDVTLLVTSRERLHLNGETVFPLRGLNCEARETGKTEEIGGGEALDAARLFVQSAQRVDVDFDPAAESLHVADICCLVEGMPLAIELAAAWVRVIPCAEIAGEIRADLAMLSRAGHGARDPETPDRHSSLGAVFEHSWRLLGKAEQQVYMQLSIFRGGFDREAARTVAGIGARASLPLLRSLVDKSLLRLTPSGRYEIHTLLRQAAGAKLAAHPRLVETTCGLHAAYYTALSFRWKDALMGGRTQAALDAIAPEIDNIQAAWRWAVDQADLVAIARGVIPLSRYYLLREPFAEGASLFGQAARRVEGWPAQSSVQSSVQSPRVDDAGRLALLSRLLIEEARFLNEQGIYDQAAAVAEEAFNVARMYGAAGLEAVALRQRGEALWYLGDYAGARPSFELALGLVQQARRQEPGTKAATSPASSPVDLLRVDLLHIKAALLKCTAQLNWATGAHAQAQSYAEQALARFQRVGDRRGEGLTLNLLGVVATERGDLSKAMVYFDESLGLRRMVGDRQGEGLTLVNLGAIAQRLGDSDRARAFNQQALRICSEIGDRRGESVAIHNLGVWAMKVGAYETARGYLEESLHIRRQIGERRGEIGSLQSLALLYHRLGDDGTARTLGRQAESIAQEIGDHHSKAFALITLGRVYQSAGALDEAEDAYRHALEIRRALDQPHLALEPLAGLAQVALGTGRRDEALAFAEQVWAYLAERRPEGVLDPLWIHLSCYQVMAGAGDPRAEAVIRAGHQLLQEKAATIADEAVRRSFFENVAVNREIVRIVETAVTQRAAE